MAGYDMRGLSLERRLDPRLRGDKRGRWARGQMGKSEIKNPKTK